VFFEEGCVIFFKVRTVELLASIKYHEISQNRRIRIYVSFLFSSYTSEKPLQTGKKKPKKYSVGELALLLQDEHTLPKTRSSFVGTTTRSALIACLYNCHGAELQGHAFFASHASFYGACASRQRWSMECSCAVTEHLQHCAILC